MKTWIVFLLVVGVSFSAFGQTAPKKKKTSRAKQTTSAAPHRVKRAKPAAVAPAPEPSAAVLVQPANIDTKPEIPAKPVARPITAQADEQRLQKIIDFQKQRALSGSDSAQYDLGMRYLNGDGVPKSIPEGRQWLEMSAKQGNTMAIRKLEQMKTKK